MSRPRWKESTSRLTKPCKQLRSSSRQCPAFTQFLYSAQFRRAASSDNAMSLRPRRGGVGGGAHAHGPGKLSRAQASKTLPCGASAAPPQRPPKCAASVVQALRHRSQKQAILVSGNRQFHSHLKEPRKFSVLGSWQRQPLWVKLLGFFLSP